MGSSDAGLVLDLAQNCVLFFFPPTTHQVFLLHYFPSLHPILQSQGFLSWLFSVALGGYVSCVFILRNLSFPHARSCFLPAFAPLFDLVQPAQFCCCKALASRPSRCEVPAGQRWSMGCRSPLTRLRVLLKAQYACCRFCISPTHTHSLALCVFRMVPFLCRPAEGAS